MWSRFERKERKMIGQEIGVFVEPCKYCLPCGYCELKNELCNQNDPIVLTPTWSVPKVVTTPTEITTSTPERKEEC